MSRFKVYFDGKCVVCSHEIEFYRRRAGAEKIDWVDISLLSFDALAEGLDPREVTRVFHVRDEAGRLITGVDAFIEIWKRLPSLALWAAGARLPGARPLMQVGYWAFVRIRPWLPRRKDECPDGTCEHRYSRSV